MQCEAVTPGEYRSKGRGLLVRFGFHPTPFGECLVALTDRGICFFGFVRDGERANLLAELQRDWANATLTEDPARTAAAVRQVFSPTPGVPLTLHLRGTNFQIKVWEALLRLPAGEAISYEALAEQVCSAKAARAVGSAVARNPLAYIIPCHRVLQKTGNFGEYRYGSARKKAILAWELSRIDH